MKIYTRTGDKGETSLFGGERVPKDDIRIEANGLIDELNSVIGVAVNEVTCKDIINLLAKIQNQLFEVTSDIAAPKEKANIKRIDNSYPEFIEKEIDEYNSRLPELKNFILPGGSKGASYLHLARTICRSAERKAVTLKKSVEIGDNIIIYLNRLSDLFFVLARYENNYCNIPDVIWKS